MPDDTPPLTHLTVGTTDLLLCQGDLTNARVDAIVNAARPSLTGGGGVDGAIHRRGGKAILDACLRIRKERYPDGLPTGEAVLTTGGDLPARFVIHTVGPVWQGGRSGEADLLAQCYHNALRLAVEAGLRSVAFPAISTGAYGFPIHEAAPIALTEGLTFIRAHPGALDEIRYVLFTASDLRVYAATLSRLAGDAGA